MSSPFVLSKEVMMKSKLIGKRIMVWECCGHIWQLMMSRLYPDRVDWAPECPSCRKTGLSWRELKRGKCPE